MNPEVYLACFSTPNFSKSAAILEKSARKNGIQNIFHYTDADIKGTQFYNDNIEIFNLKRGYGYWLWKPYIILESLLKMPNDSILVYCDAGVEIIHPLDKIIKLCAEKEEILLFKVHGYKNRQLVKRDSFVLMNCDDTIFHNGDPVQASFIVLKKTERVIAFVREWLQFCTDSRILTDQPNEMGKENFDDFRESYGDQSVICLLRMKHLIKLYRNPSQEGKPYINQYKDSDYPTVLNHHWGRPDGRFAGPVRSILLKFGIWRY